MVIVEVQLVLRKGWNIIMGSSRSDKPDICPLKNKEICQILIQKL
jgi:hypothetical protein